MNRVEVVNHGVFKRVDPYTHPDGRRFVKINVRYGVKLSVCEGMASDGMWSTLYHAARFARQEDAEALAERVRAALRKAYDDERAGRPVEGWGGINLEHWTWSPSQSCPFSDLQKAPTAKEYDVG